MIATSTREWYIGTGKLNDGCKAVVGRINAIRIYMRLILRIFTFICT